MEVSVEPHQLAKAIAPSVYINNEFVQKTVPDTEKMP